MKRTLLILAGAVALDLGVMAVAAQAQTSGNLSVSALQNGRVVASTRTDARGEFSLALSAGSYQLCVAGLREASAGQGRAGSATTTSCTPMNVPAATRSTNADRIVQPVAASWPRWLRWLLGKSDPRIPLTAQPAPGQVVVLGTISGQ